MTTKYGYTGVAAIDDAPRDSEGVVGYMQRVSVRTLEASWQALVLDELASDKPSLAHVARMLGMVQVRLVKRAAAEAGGGAAASNGAAAGEDTVPSLPGVPSAPGVPGVQAGEVGGRRRPKGTLREAAINRLAQLPIGRAVLVSDLPKVINMPRNELESLRVGIIQGARMPAWLKVSWVMLKSSVRRWRVERVGESEQAA